MSLDTIWATIGGGAVGYIGFSSDAEQAPDHTTLKLWVSLNNCSLTKGKIDTSVSRAVISELCEDVVWDGDDALVTLHFLVPPEDPEEFLDELVAVIDRKLYEAAEREYFAYLEADHGDDDYDSFPDEGRIVNFTGDPGGLTGCE